MTGAESKSKILFVDDEDNVLRGLARMLRTRRDAWDMSFVNSGQAALDFLEKNKVEVVVSDMRMPGMNGAELLNKVRERWPDTIRIVLSGFAERESILKTIGPSHRYLAKPCTEQVLTEAITHSLKLRKQLQAETLRKAITGLTHIPTLPDVYARVLRELSDELASAESLAEIVEKDVSISAQLMKLTNSAYFSLQRPCTTVKQAINFIGFENVRATVLLAGVFEQFRSIAPTLVQVVERLTRRSIGIATLAQAIARNDGASQEIADQSFCAGVLAHLGTIVLIANQPKQFVDAMSKADTARGSWLDTEYEMFGATHAQIGGYILGLWGFSDGVVEAVTYHHNPSALTSAAAPILTAVHVAQYMTRLKATGHGELDQAYLSASGQTERLKSWQSVFEEVTKDWPDE
ncbi:MAG: HDOD domain-containing protein [Rhodobacteraceae bacterium]|nr:HDOD domain-containing protein [Paracoccaceae bacterium]